jgi:hypothetical protein
VSLGFRSSHTSVPQRNANFGIGTLERIALKLLLSCRAMLQALLKDAKYRSGARILSVLTPASPG